MSRLSDRFQKKIRSRVCAWLTPEQQYKPMSRAQINAGKKWIKENKDNPDPEVRRALQTIGERIGPNWDQ
jgi:hypothetical protein